MVIASVEGVLRSLDSDCAIVDVGGISFRILVPISTLINLGAVGDRVQLNTHLQVKEDSLTLYGFSTKDELKLFELLISVTGVGPRMALSILSVLSPDRLARAITAGDSDTLSSISGVGKKTAARIVLELRGKFDHEIAPVSYPQEEVKAALVGLGYSVAEAMEAIGKIPDSPDLPLEDRIMLALRHLSKIK
jgi:Holliday junction DNA helicase RuvA